jgi:hypothetical protein
MSDERWYWDRYRNRSVGHWRTADNSVRVGPIPLDENGRAAFVPASELERLRGENEKLKEALFECAKRSGADISDGAPTWPPIHDWAVQQVTELRADYDEAISSLFRASEER